MRWFCGAIALSISAPAALSAPPPPPKCTFFVQVMYVKSSAMFWETIYQTSDVDEAMDVYGLLLHYKSKGKLAQHVPPKGGWVAYDVRLVAVCHEFLFDLSDSPPGPQWDSRATKPAREDL